MDKVAYQLVVCCLMVTYFLSTPVIGCGRSKTSGCTDSECDAGTCFQIDDYVTRECGANNELRLKRARKVIWTKLLFRVLRDDEDPKKGLSAKKPDATKDVQSHVQCGSRPNYSSQYISTTSDLQAAQDWASLSIKKDTTKQHTICMIDQDRLTAQGINVIDVTLPGVLKGVTAPNFAKRYHEVLVEGRIPANCILKTMSVNLTSQVFDSSCEWKNIS